MKNAMLAGAIGGIMGAGVKQLCEAIVPPRAPGREPPPGVLVAKLVRAAGGGDLSKPHKERVSLAIHWTFSIATSALYGASVRATPRRRIADGIGFGLVLWAGLHELMLPVLGATPPLGELPAGEQVNECINHAIFGATVETVRAVVLR